MKRARTVDEYIGTSEEWQAELVKLRKILVGTGLTEEIKWGAPCYTINGKNVVGMVAYKSYFGLWFHQGVLLKDDQQVLMNAQEGKTKALRQWRMRTAAEIKPVLVKRYVREACQLARDGRETGPVRKKPLVVPPELRNALQADKAALKKFESLTPGRQREYAEYVAEAKRAETRLNRITRIMPTIKSGGGLNDKYR